MEIPMKLPNLKVMSLDQLLALRANVESILSQRVATEKRELQEKLAKLEGFGGAGRGRRGRPHALKGVKVPPKYRGPEGETWAGRGAQPKWLTALLKSGAKLEDFAIDGAEGGARRTTARRGGRKRSAARKSA